MNRLLLALLVALGARGEAPPAPAPLALECPSHWLAQPLHAEVYVPEGYTAAPARRYPLCLLLHGGGGTARGLRDLGLADLATRHQVIIVAPDAGPALFVDPPGGAEPRLGSVLLDELLPEVDRRFRTLGGASGRLLAGLSLGGYAALRLGLERPGRFSRILSLSGLVEVARWRATDEAFLPPAVREQIDRALGLPGSPARRRADLAALLAGIRRQDLPALDLACGAEDAFLPSNLRFAEALEQADIPHELVVSPGGHDGAFWARQLDEALRAWRGQKETRAPG